MRRFMFRLMAACLVLAAFLFGNVTSAGAKKMTLSVTAETTKPTNKAVKVRISAEGAEEIKWSYGIKGAAYFRKYGHDVLDRGKDTYFLAKKNDTYSVYAKDKQGNEKIHSIIIENIDQVKPSVKYHLDATDRSLAEVRLDIFDQNEISDARYYYGKLTKEKDDRWKNGIELDDTDTFCIYKNGITTVRIEDEAGNVTLKTIEVKYINTTNRNVNYGLKEDIQVIEYYGKTILRMNAVREASYGNNLSGYIISYYVKNVDYGGMNTFFPSSRKFRVYDAAGNELTAVPYEYDAEHGMVNQLPKQVSSGTDCYCSMFVYGREKPAYVEYQYWNEMLGKNAIRILLTDDFAQESEMPGKPFYPEIRIEKVSDWNINGEIYTGTLVNGKKHGAGRCIYPDGSVYEGEFEDGKRNGYGRMEYRDHSTYEGEFINDERDGFGIFREYVGDVFSGYWKGGSRLRGRIVDYYGKIHYVGFDS